MARVLCRNQVGAGEHSERAERDPARLPIGVATR